MRIDHAIVAVADLDDAVERFEEAYALPATGGGRHEGLGTRNRIVPLGGGYLELLAVDDPDEAEGSDLGRALIARLEHEGEGLMGWVVAVDDVAPVARRLGTEVTTIRREGLSARLTGVREALAEPLLPFFIERAPESADPGAEGDAGGITRIALDGDAARLDSWLGQASLPVEVAAGSPRVRAVGIDRGWLAWPPEGAQRA
jgi:Glyoxalase-like domain